MSYFENLEQRWPLTVAERMEINDIHHALGKIGLGPVRHDPTSVVYRMQAERVIKLNQELEVIKDGVWRRRIYALVGRSHLDGTSRAMLSPPKGAA